MMSGYQPFDADVCCAHSPLLQPANKNGCKVRLDIRPSNIGMRLAVGKWLPVLEGLDGFRAPDDVISVKSKPSTPIK
jgi:hypothetical protein